MPLTDLVRHLNHRQTLRGGEGRFDLVDGRAALRVGEWLLGSAFQPVVDASSGHAIGHEAQLAVQAGPAGVPAQALFLGMDSADAVAQLDGLCRQLHALNFLLEPAHQGFLSLNVHPCTAARWRAHAVTVLDPVLMRCGLQPEQLVLEFADDGFGSPLALATAIDACRREGHRVALDNYGRHSADLRRVEALMPDIVKLDSSVIGHSGHLSLARRVLMGLTAEFRRMGVVAVCQWIENPLQLQVARDVGVDWLQGRLLGRPQPRCVPTLPDRPRRERAAA